MPGSPSYFARVLAGPAYGSRSLDPDRVEFELRGRVEHGPADAAPDCAGDGVVALQRSGARGTGPAPAPHLVGWAVAPPPGAATFHGWVESGWILSWTHSPGELTLHYQASPTPVHRPQPELRFHPPHRLRITAGVTGIEELVRRAGDLFPVEPRPAGPEPPP